MRLKTTTANACQETLLRGGFEDANNPQCLVLQLGGEKPGPVIYQVWFPHDGDRRDWFVRIRKETVAGPKISDGWVDWDWTNVITLILV